MTTSQGECEKMCLVLNNSRVLMCSPQLIIDFTNIVMYPKYFEVLLKKQTMK